MTRSASNALPATARVADALYRARDYVLSRQCASGGFCWYRSGQVDEPNLDDTWHALAALSLLGCSIPNYVGIQVFLDASQPAQPVHALFCAVEIARLLDSGRALDDTTLAAVDGLATTKSPRPDDPNVSNWLARARRIVRLRAIAGRQRDSHGLAEQLAHLCRNGGYGGRPNLWDTWQALDILAACATSPIGSSIDFVDGLQEAQQGFIPLSAGGLATLEALYAGVEACALLGIKVRFPDATLASVLACQTANGGFARIAGALPDLELTHYAVSVLRSLGSGGTHSPLDWR